MKTLAISSVTLLFITQAQASFMGDYQLIKGSTLCPIGSISLRTDLKDKTRTVLFGSSLSWVLNLEDKSSVKEVVDGGCTYTMAYEKTENTFIATTSRNICPKSSENGVIRETLDSKNDKLNYQYEFISQDNKKSSYSCIYHKRK
jgi:hypothetical protein